MRLAPTIRELYQELMRLKRRHLPMGSKELLHVHLIVPSDPNYSWYLEVHRDPSKFAEPRLGARHTYASLDAHSNCEHIARRMVAKVKLAFEDDVSMVPYVAPPSVDRVVL